jgi:NitT/TauT family transport system ATP-binding protein
VTHPSPAAGGRSAPTLGDGIAPGRLVLRDVTKTYGRDERAVHALDSTSIDIEAADFVAILGPSGCGKTTLLKIIGDIIGASSGTVLIDDQPASEIRKARHIGYAFQNPVLLPWRDIRSNVALPFEIAERRHFRRISSTTRDRIDAVLDTVGLAAFADRLPRELSGGMQSRVALARALVHEPRILLMDEPFAALDELTRTEMALHLLDVWQRVRTTVVFVTHHIHEAILLSNRIIVMSDRPGHVRRDIPVDLPRPRSVDTTRSETFRQLAEDLITDFHSRRGHVEAPQPS